MSEILGPRKPELRRIELVFFFSSDIPIHLAVALEKVSRPPKLGPLRNNTRRCVTLCCLRDCEESMAQTDGCLLEYVDSKGTAKSEPAFRVDQPEFLNTVKNIFQNDQIGS